MAVTSRPKKVAYPSPAASSVGATSKRRTPEVPGVEEDPDESAVEEDLDESETEVEEDQDVAKRTATAAKSATKPGQRKNTKTKKTSGKSKERDHESESESDADADDIEDFESSKKAQADQLPETPTPISRTLRSRVVHDVHKKPTPKSKSVKTARKKTDQPSQAQGVPDTDENGLSEIQRLPNRIPRAPPTATGLMATGQDYDYYVCGRGGKTIYFFPDKRSGNYLRSLYPKSGTSGNIRINLGYQREMLEKLLKQNKVKLVMAGTQQICGKDIELVELHITPPAKNAQQEPQLCRFFPTDLKWLQYVIELHKKQKEAEKADKAASG